MKYHLSHTTKQFYCKWGKLLNDPLYKIFSAIYQMNYNRWSTVCSHPEGIGYLLADFCCPDFSAYRGKELVYFNGRKICVYWLPGALHSAGGFVKEGTYSVMLGRFALKHPLYLQLTKTQDKTTIDSLSLMPESNTSYQQLNGGFITYEAIKKEMRALIIQWLSFIKKSHLLSNTTQDNAKLHKIVRQCDEAQLQ